MKRLKGIFLLISMLGILSCESTPEIPQVSEVITKIIGKYCSADASHRLELTADYKYVARRNKKSPLGATLIQEKCEGTTKVRFDSETLVWTLQFQKSEKNSNPFISCKPSTVILWEAEKGWVMGEAPITLLEPFDQTPVTNQCDN